MNKKTTNNQLPKTSIYATVAVFLTYTMIFSFSKIFTVAIFDRPGIAQTSYSLYYFSININGRLDNSSSIIYNYHGIKPIASTLIK